MKRPGWRVYLVAGSLALGSLSSGLLLTGEAAAQGQELPPVKVNLPPSPNFGANRAPERYEGGEVSVYGLRKNKNHYLDKDVRVKGYLVELYECPAEQRKCNEELERQQKKAAKSGGQAPGTSPSCRPCDQPHFFLADTPETKKERAILVADYPVKSWKTGKASALKAKVGDPYVVTGTFAINSPGGFAASDGLLIHKKLEDASGTVVAEGNSILPPEALKIELAPPPPRSASR